MMMKISLLFMQHQLSPTVAAVVQLFSLFFLLVNHNNGAVHAFPSSSLLSSLLSVPSTTTTSSVSPSSLKIATSTTTHDDIIDTTTTTTSQVDDTTSIFHHPISLEFDTLTKRLEKGEGRSRAVWDCYRLGIDPILFYSEDTVEESELDESVMKIMEAENDKERQQESPIIAKVWTREEIRSQIKPKRRRNQGLGKSALALMGSPIEESVATISEISISKDSTTKLLVKLLKDQLEVETVIIPWKETGKSTLCISSQVGCRQGCVFCATGKMGRIRNLSTEEILVQVFLAIKTCRCLASDKLYPIDGIVYMGMGDAADNSNAVIESAKILTNQNQFGLAQRKVTISTIGPTPDSFLTLGKAPAALAWSVHATTDNLRRKLVPTTKYTMEELKAGYLNAMKQRPIKLRTTMLEIVLIRNVNDSIEDANHLSEFVQSMYNEVEGIKPMVNLIPFNDIGHGEFQKPTQDQLMIFQSRLTSKGIKCFVRTTRGDEESSACGQLATTAKRKKKERKDSKKVEKN